ncbi:MAG: hypothetical protein IJ783_05780, partial [Kiritimatiellae bacterium]|nr:hypothetical protein [Kiritimatiellia bacterium]
MTTPVVKLFGFGGAGGRLADFAAASSGGHFAAVAADTDFAAVSSLGSCRQIRVGESTLRGLGSGGDVSAAAMAA